MTPAQKTAVAMLSRRALSSVLLCRKLADKGYSPDEADEAARYCAEMGYLDDEQYARRVCDLQKSKGYAGYALKQRLRQQGVPSEWISRLAAEDAESGGEDETRTIDRLLQKIHKAARPWDEGERRRCMAALMRRGHSPSAARSALSRAVNNAEIEDLPEYDD